MVWVDSDREWRQSGSLLESPHESYNHNVHDTRHFVHLRMGFFGQPPKKKSAMSASDRTDKIHDLNSLVRPLQC